ncbi:MAG: DinB family protein [Flavobacteriales bacterium]|jgi:hypothetical protein|nr:DinB family protein [Flavobacteriales bacterium]
MNAHDRPGPDELPAYYGPYVQAASAHDLAAALAHPDAGFGGLIGLVGPDRAEHRYAPGKWSIKEVVQHVIDAERVFAYRALRFARQDTTALPGFDEDAYAPASEAGRRSLEDLVAEAARLRLSSIDLFGGFTPEMLMRRGTASGQAISVRALGWVIAGHAAHHLAIIHQRYL